MTKFERLNRHFPGLLDLRRAALQTRDSETTIEEFMKALGIDDQNRREAVTIAQDLEDIGAAKFIFGRRGHPSRLKWAPIDDDASVDVSERSPVVPHGAADIRPPLTLNYAIAEAKRALSDALGVPETAIDITIHT